ncbi:hypothetical protein Sjap_024282 [Stephania japonica]|uniref:Uncharacterized protein n=1 Tax=Stephania japonica TaxID=461633 RepID=A0AAP0ED45_9MAGN
MNCLPRLASPELAAGSTSVRAIIHVCNYVINNEKLNLDHYSVGAQWVENLRQSRVFMGLIVMGETLKGGSGHRTRLGENLGWIVVKTLGRAGCFTVGNGAKIKFWKDRRCGIGSFDELYPDLLFELARESDTPIYENVTFKAEGANGSE